jgi:hypothetical protein
MRHGSTILLTGAILALTLASPAPASAKIDRLCMKWLYFKDYDRTTHSYVIHRGRCLEWKTIEIPEPVVLFNRSIWAQEPGDPSPWITEREYKDQFKFKGQDRALNPQPIPPGKRKKVVKRGR